MAIVHFCLNHASDSDRLGARLSVPELEKLYQMFEEVRSTLGALIPL